ncbi:beta-ketoacyl synthase N-terminal-like domain-containing protein [Streptomyces sp. V1I6]|uniref:beta-ketoacyl synthase N-terminal-like domain-containing protein n=1 Tax=Streptomyces sp. V1I6 TaxID=3042273 RepID=UPI00278900D4|nr:beta-ketoacyl synthase N-terminal-like domain-containing protein [Streptomyces sp. V1I6]MDQ0847810.1 acyl transferase domain-containing protein/acyl carrier protein [Streptomyces sp. V1I6]
MTTPPSGPDLGQDPNAVAVVGMACRFGPATSVERLWELLEQQRTGIRRYSADELIALGHDPRTVRHEAFVPAGAVLEDADAFDAEFFGYSAQHAEWLDPQQRLLLEVAWHALEDAGFAPDATGLRTGVYASVGQPVHPPVRITELDAAGMMRFSSTDKDFAAGRISYKLGLTGPSMSVQSACSSTLVGLHLAAEGLLAEECDLAVVAGASLYFPQAGYLAAPSMILSPSGECRPFDDTADGTVFGNGGGALVLRRLADALRDGDPVRAVLRGSAVGNDGARKMDYHAPSPEGQEAVIREALAVAGVDPHSVGCLETHGTGTPMGDPIEFAALERVYGGDRPHPAAVGSVKSVLGHLNTAAGVAGVIKAVLALEHATVPRQVPFTAPNRALGGTGGLRIASQDATADGWPVPDGPRRAAVSSFGIGGTNAHAVLEQAPPTTHPQQHPHTGQTAQPQQTEHAGQDAGDGPVRWALLSAHTETALRTWAGALAGPAGRLPLADVVHTLRTGRSHRRVRCALSAATPGELAAKLRTVADGGDLAADEAPKDLHPWLTGQGPLPDAGPESRPARRVRLPGYPFARTRWPRPGDDGQTRTVRPDEPVAADHVVAGRPVLPAAAQLDLALRAARRSTPEATGLADIAFHRPVEVTAPVTLRTVADGDTLRIVSDHTHTQARVVTAPAAPPAPLDGAALSAAYPDSAEPAELYRYFEDNGVRYGPAFQVLRELRHGPGGALARVTATAAAPDVDGQILSPYVLDGALQTVIGCVLREDLGGQTFIPFAVDALSVHGPLPDEVWVQVRPRRLAGGGRQVRKYDVTVSAPDGTPALTLTGLALRPTGPAPTAPTASTASTASAGPVGSVVSAGSAVPAGAGLPAGVHLFTPADVPFTPDTDPAAGAAGWGGPLVVIGEAPLEGADLRLPDPPDADAAAATGADLAARLPDGGVPVIVWPLPATTPAPGPGSDALRVLALLRALLGPLARRGARIVVPHPAGAFDDAAAVTGNGLAALGRSLAGENPRFHLTALALDPGTTPAALTRAVRAAAAHPPAARRLSTGHEGALTEPVLRPLAVPAPARPAFRHGGRYWINGMGALAALLAGHLADTYAAHIVVTGRSPAEGERAAEIARLSRRAARTGGSVTYHRLDSTDAAAVRALADRLHGEGTVHGVLHCAGTLRDSFVLRKDSADADAVIAAKLTSAAALDEATAHWPLDCFVVYSSVSGALGSPGQADYAFANAAADELLTRRARRVTAGTRHGRSLSIAWPYWTDGSMRTGGDAEQILGAFGMRPMPADVGLAVLETLLGTPDDQDLAPAPVVLYGDLPQLRASFPLLTGPEPTPAPAAQAPATPAPAVPVAAAAVPVAVVAAGAGALEDRLRAAVAEATRTPVADVTPDRPFDDLGIDSLLAIRVVELLEKDFGRLSKTLLFECRSVAELTEHLLEEFPERCAELTGTTTDTTTAGGTGPAPAPAGPPPAAEPPASSTAPLDTTPAPASPAGSTGRAELPDASGDIDPRAVAIIGVAGRFPEAEGLDELWANLLAGRDSITEVPRERWDAEALYDPDRSRVDRTYTKWGGFLQGVENFDAPLFSISPREAGTVDPQARLFLEACWAALDDAGYTPDTLVNTGDPVHRKDVGVFVGAMYGEYQLHEAEERLRGNPVLANSAYWSIANRVSYFFDFQGPSTAVDTACSSALTAIHLAVESLRAGSSKVAVAGGVNVLIHPNKYFMLGQGRFAAGDGRCRSFGAGGDGYVPGEGVGAFVLKPLGDALRDGDHIHAVIRGTAANHGGRTNGYTVPNPRAQADLVTKALRDAGLAAGDLDYVEAHGTGTALGDPIEIRGLVSAFARDGVKGPGDVPIGSVKSNVGHLESAAGAVALAKVLLQMRHRTLVPSLHATPANPEIDFGRVPFTVQQSTAPWHTRDGSPRPLRAGISSFGAGGANAHIVVESPPPTAPRPPSGPQQVVVFLSARTDQALADTARHLHRHLTGARAFGQEPRLADIAHTYAVGRPALERRAALAADSLDALLASLEALAAGRPRPWRRTEAAADDPVRVWLDGGRIDRATVSGAGPGARRIPLPHYPFERIRCWYDLQIEHLHHKGLGTVTGEPALSRPHLRDFGRPHTPDTAAAPDPAHTPDTAAAPDPAPAPEPAPVPRRAPEPATRPAPALVPRPAPASPPTAPGPVPLPATDRPDPQEIPPMTRDRKISLRPLGTAPTPAPAPAAAPAPAPAPAAPVAPAPAPVAVAPAPAPVAVAVDPAVADRVAEEVGEVLAGVLYMEPADLDPEQSFQMLGVDSILSVEFIALVNAKYATDIKATELYDHPTPAAFARHVAATLGATSPSAPAPVPHATTPAPAPVAPAAPVPAPTPAAPVPAGERTAAVLETLREQLAQTLYCDVWDIDTDATFNSLGLDSILGVEFVAFLNNAYGLDEKAGVLYDHPSLAALAAHITSRTTSQTAGAVPAGSVSAADLDALLAAVRDNRLTVEQALALLPQHT